MKMSGKAIRYLSIVMDIIKSLEQHIEGLESRIQDLEEELEKERMYKDES